MQQETPRVGSEPTLPAPSMGPKTPRTEDGGEGFYQPSTESAYVPVAEHEPQAPIGHVTDDLPESVSWEASEYIHTDKGALWLTIFLLVVAVMVGLAIWFNVWTFAALIIVMAITMGVFAFRPPRTLHYTLDRDGIHVGNKTYYYNDFKSFGVLEDGAFFTINLIPVKRFSPAVNIYFAESEGEQIIDIVGERLPMEELHPDLLDNIMRLLRF